MNYNSEVMERLKEANETDDYIPEYFEEEIKIGLDRKGGGNDPY